MNLDISKFVGIGATVAHTRRDDIGTITRIMGKNYIILWSNGKLELCSRNMVKI